MERRKGRGRGGEEVRTYYVQCGVCTYVSHNAAYAHEPCPSPSPPPSTAYCVAKVPEATETTSTADSTTCWRGGGLGEEGANQDTHNKHTYNRKL